MWTGYVRKATYHDMVVCDYRSLVPWLPLFIDDGAAYVVIISCWRCHSHHLSTYVGSGEWKLELSEGNSWPMVVRAKSRFSFETPEKRGGVKKRNLLHCHVWGSPSSLSLGQMLACNRWRAHAMWREKVGFNMIDIINISRVEGNKCFWQGKCNSVSHVKFHWALSQESPFRLTLLINTINIFPCQKHVLLPTWEMLIMLNPTGLSDCDPNPNPFERPLHQREDVLRAWTVLETLLLRIPEHHRLTLLLGPYHVWDRQIKGHPSHEGRTCVEQEKHFWKTRIAP